MKNTSANFLILVMRFLLLHCCASFAMTVLGSSDFFKLGTVLLICMLLFYFWGTKIKNGIIFIFIHMLVLTAFSLPFEGILRGAVIICICAAVTYSFMERFKSPVPKSMSGLFSLIFAGLFAAGLYLGKNSFLPLCSAEAVLFVSLKFVCDSIINTNEFIEINKKDDMLPEKAMRKRLLIFSAISASITAAGMIAAMNSEIPTFFENIVKILLNMLSSHIGKRSPLHRETMDFSVMPNNALPEISNIKIETGFTIPPIFENIGKFLLWIIFIAVGIYFLKILIIKMKYIISRFYFKDKEQDLIEFIPPENSEILLFTKRKRLQFKDSSSANTKIRKMYRKYILKNKNEIRKSLTPTQISKEIGMENSQTDTRIREIYEEAKYSSSQCNFKTVEEMKKLIKSKK